MEQPREGSTEPQTPSVEDRIDSLLGGAPEVDADETEEVSGDEAVEDDGTEPFEIDGVEYRLPKDLKAKVSEWRDGSLRHGDYTSKTQELAEMRKHVAAIAETAKARQEFEASVSDETQELARIKGQLAQYKGVDWGSLDVDTHLKFKAQMDGLKERAGEIEQTLKTKAQQFAEWAEGKKSEMLQSGQRYLQQTIKGWGPEAEKAVIAAAKEVGYTDHELGSVFDPRFVRLSWKAAQFDKLQASKGEALEKANKAPPVVKPGANDPRVSKQIEHMNFRKAIKSARSDGQRAELIGEKLAKRFNF